MLAKVKKICLSECFQYSKNRMRKSWEILSTHRNISIRFSAIQIYIQERYFSPGDKKDLLRRQAWRIKNHSAFSLICTVLLIHASISWEPCFLEKLSWSRSTHRASRHSPIKGAAHGPVVQPKCSGNHSPAWKVLQSLTRGGRPAGPWSHGSYSLFTHRIMWCSFTCLSLHFPTYKVRVIIEHKSGGIHALTGLTWKRYGSNMSCFKLAPSEDCDPIYKYPEGATYIWEFHSHCQIWISCVHPGSIYWTSLSRASQTGLCDRVSSSVSENTYTQQFNIAHLFRALWLLSVSISSCFYVKINVDILQRRMQNASEVLG